MTLPVILAMQSPELNSGSPDDRTLIERILSSGSTTPADLEFVRRAVEETGSIEATREKASEYIDCALENIRPLPPSPYRDSLELLAEGILSRRKVDGADRRLQGTRRVLSYATALPRIHLVKHRNPLECEMTCCR